MQIGCTKKLADYLGISLPNADPDTEPFFSFSANLLTFNRRKCIVVMHNASYCGFVLFGVTAKEKKNLQELFQAGLRKMLEAEHYKENVIDRFLLDCSFPVALTKTVDRSQIARLVKFCDRAVWALTQYGDESLYQEHLLPILNYDVVCPHGDYRQSFITFEKLAELSRLRYGSVYGEKTGVFDITLKLMTPCVRRVTIPLPYNLYVMHRVIQSLFLWQDYHLHQFILEKGKNGRSIRRAGIPYEWEMGLPQDDDLQDETLLRLEDVFAYKKKIVYEYDMGDGWEHEIKLVRILPDEDQIIPQCIEAVGSAPPEDCGGPYGFAQLLQALQDKNDPQHEDMVEWFGCDTIPEPNIDEINRKLRREVLTAWREPPIEDAYEEDDDDEW